METLEEYESYFSTNRWWDERLRKKKKTQFDDIRLAINEIEIYVWSDLQKEVLSLIHDGSLKELEIILQINLEKNGKRKQNN